MFGARTALVNPRISLDSIKSTQIRVMFGSLKEIRYSLRCELIVRLRLVIENRIDIHNEFCLLKQRVIRHTTVYRDLIVNLQILAGNFLGVYLFLHIASTF
jgi:hypothetical protein